MKDYCFRVQGLVTKDAMASECVRRKTFNFRLHSPAHECLRLIFLVILEQLEIVTAARCFVNFVIEMQLFNNLNLGLGGGLFSRVRGGACGGKLASKLVTVGNCDQAVKTAWKTKGV